MTFDPPDVPAESSPALFEVFDALRPLSSRQRGAVILHYFEDLPITEVAKRLGSTPAAVGVHLHRARKHLRRLLEEPDA